MKYYIIAGFRPHACGVDIHESRMKQETKFQTPRLWGGYQHSRGQRCLHLSDPTPVGWINYQDQLLLKSFFRPHACGVDYNPPLTYTEQVFQTPRLWGG